MLSVQTISVMGGRRCLIDHVSFEVQPGMMVGFVGPNGAGKSTLFKAIVGVHAISTGVIMFNHRVIHTLSVAERVQFGLALLAQKTTLFPTLTVFENLQLVLELHRHRHCLSVQEVLETVDLWPVAHEKTWTLSGGQQQRAAIARLLLIKPSMMLLDEPFAAMDPVSITLLYRMLINLIQHQGLSVLITDHHAKLMEHFCTYWYFLHQGAIMCHGLPADVKQHQEANSLYFDETPYN
jgi:lipopolysaccharide export system ATP-binding protein